MRIELAKSESQEAIETVYFHDMPSVADDISEDVELALPRRRKPEYKVEDVETEFGVKVPRKKRQPQDDTADGANRNVRGSFKMKLRQDTIGPVPGSPGSSVGEEFDFRLTPVPEKEAPVWSEDSEDASLQLKLRPKKKGQLAPVAKFWRSAAASNTSAETT